MGRFSTHLQMNFCFFWLYMDNIFYTKNTEHDADETQKIIQIIPETCFLFIVNAVAV